MKPVSPRGQEGFSLVEAIAGLVLFTLMMGALTYGAASLFRFQGHSSVTFQDQTYSLAPSLPDFHRAVSMQALFSQSADQADSILVFGGQRSHPSLDPNGPSSTLASAFADTSLSAAAGSDPFKGFSSWTQRELNASQLDSYLTTQPDPADFTILTIQGMSRITSITQQRRYTSTINGEQVVLYEVTFNAIDWSSGSPAYVADPETGGAPTGSYRIYYSLNEDTWAQPPGATHYWYRSDTDWDRVQEGPTRVIFADPYVLAGQDPLAQIKSVSRFSYFLPQVR